MNERVLLLLAAGAAALWSFRRWREAVKVGLVLLIFEGALRKWVLPGAQDLIYFAKDVFFLGAYAGFLRQRPGLRYRAPANPPLYIALVIAALFGLFQVFNPQLPNLLVGLLGFKAYFFYVPLIFVMPAVFPSDAELARFLRRYVLIAIPVGLLAVSQFFSPTTSVINRYAWNANDIQYVATFGSSTYVRVTGTFSFITGYTSYLLATSVLALTVLGVWRWRLRGNLLLYLAFAMTLLGMLMSGSRGPVYLFVLLFPLYWWLAVAREKGSGSTFGRLLVGLSLVAIFLFWVGGDAISAFYGRASGASDVGNRMASPVTAPYFVLPQAGLLGFGIGATHQSAMVVTRGVPPYSWLRGLAVEAETGRIMIELGPLGFALIHFIRIYLTIFAFRQVLALRTRFHRSVAIAGFLFLLAQLPGGAVFDVTAGVYYWFFAGLLMVAIRLDRQAATVPAPKTAAPLPRDAAPVPVAESPWRSAP